MISYPVPPISLADGPLHIKLLAQAVVLLMGGKMNAVTELNLNPGATTTTITDARIGAFTHIDFCPLTASAATAKSALYVSDRKKGSATLTHASNAAVDQTFSVLLIG